MDEAPTRKLAVLLHADVVGSTSLVQADETIAHQRMRDAFRRFAEIIGLNGGTTHEIRGDALVAGFSSASDAVAATLAFQAANARHNVELPDEIRPAVRVGIALGEVLIADGTVTGEGIVLAQRLEQLAEPGGVCIQGAAYDTVPKRLAFAYESLGEQRLKGFEEPVRVYKVRRKATDERTDATHPEHRASASKPSIAVLPFNNMSGDREQEYFSEGITEDIITELSRSTEFLVIARNSSFQYKGQSVDIPSVGRKLGASYVVEGSVRRAGNRVRITSQLIDAEGGSHLWAERYDRELDDIFAIQDDVVRSITAAVLGRVSEEVVARAARKPTASLSAYELTLRARWLAKENYADESLLAMYDRAIELDPNYTRAYVYAANHHAYSWLGLARPPEQAKERALSYMDRALVIESFDGATHAVAARVYMMVSELALARKHLASAVALAPHDAAVMHAAGVVTGYVGGHDTARIWLERLRALDPHPGDAQRELIFDNEYMSGRYDEAVQMFVGWRQPPWHMHAELAASYGQLGRLDEAAQAKRQAELQCPAADPLPTLRRHLTMCAEQRDAEHWRDGYLKAGFQI